MQIVGNVAGGWFLLGCFERCDSARRNANKSWGTTFELLCSFFGNEEWFPLGKPGCFKDSERDSQLMVQMVIRQCTILLQVVTGYLFDICVVTVGHWFRAMRRFSIRQWFRLRQFKVSIVCITIWFNVCNYWIGHNCCTVWFVIHRVWLRLLCFAGLQDTDICRQSTCGDTAGTCKSLKIISGSLTHDVTLTGETNGNWISFSLSRAIRRIIMPHYRITACSRWTCFCSSG